jgi:hypothetical protein
VVWGIEIDHATIIHRTMTARVGTITRRKHGAEIIVNNVRTMHHDAMIIGAGT